jgi:hypothetical protein
MILAWEGTVKTLALAGAMLFVSGFMLFDTPDIPWTPMPDTNRLLQGLLRWQSLRRQLHFSVEALPQRWRVCL